MDFDDEMFEEDYGDEYYDDNEYYDDEDDFDDYGDYDDEDEEENVDDYGDEDDDYSKFQNVIDSSDYGRISFGEEQYTSGDIRDPVNITIRKLIRIIRNNYSDCLRIDENQLKYFGNFLFSFDSNQIITMNMDVFAPAILFLNKYRNTINKKNIKDFIITCDGLPYIGTDDIKGDGYVDLIRYLRMLSKPFIEYTMFSRN